jgi:hypothetical protein
MSARINGSTSSKDVLSFGPMAFGTEDDFALAITEMKWVKARQNSLSDADVDRIASKYSFPAAFLKAGLSGLKWPDEVLVSKSSWYPIIYAWLLQERDSALRLFRLQIDYWHTKAVSTIIFALMAVFVGNFIAIIYYLFKPDVFELSAGLILPSSIALATLYLQLQSSVAEKGLKLEETTSLFKRSGLEHIIANNEDFLAKEMGMVVWVGSKLYKKLEESPLRNIVAVDKAGQHVVEDPLLEYRKRISTLRP